MGTDIIWWSAIAVEAVILLRCISNGFLRKLPLFFFYVVCILATEFIRLFGYRFAPNYYSNLFWNTELLTIIASYGIVVEIFRQSLKHNPGVVRVSAKLLLIIFVAALSFAASDLWDGGFASLSRATAELGRDLRYIEGALLLVMLWLLGRYRIALDRNLLGLIVGYSFWVGLNVINYALLFSLGNGFSAGLRTMLPVTFVVTLLVWCVALWSPQPEPIQPATTRLEHDYGLLAMRTRAILARTSNKTIGARTTRP